MWQGPAAQMGGLVLFLLKRAGSCVASASGRQWFAIGKPAIGPWVAMSQPHFPKLLGVSGNAFPPTRWGWGRTQGQLCLSIV